MNLPTHVEDDQVDFYYERNIPEMLSKEGPAMAIGDVDGDGNDEFFLGGPKGKRGVIYFVTNSGVKAHEVGEQRVTK